MVSAVWEDFDRGSSLATCRTCGRTLGCRSKNGTSHLKRHLRSKICKNQAAQRRHASSTTCLPPPPEGSAALEASPADDDEGFVESIANLYDELLAKNLVDIEGGDEPAEVPGAGDGHALNNVPPMSQAVSSSLKRFFQKEKERSARSAPFKGSPSRPRTDGGTSQRIG